MRLKIPPLGARRPPSGGGFTLVEVAMAVIVLALALTTSLTALQRAFLEFDTARNLEIAGNIMQCEMEKERLFTWTAASNAAYVPVIDSSFARNPAIAGRFTLSRSLATLAAHSGQVLQITLTATWRSYDGHMVSRSYTTYYTQAGLYAYLYNNP
jgi:Tfp pilus assembly protein PilV